MRFHVLPFALGTAVTLAIADTHAGGWAVVTVDNLPQHFEVGKATELKFSVRQHGMRLLPGLTARVSAHADGQQIDAQATPGAPGYYSASVTVPRPGDWTITIQSGFGTSALRLRPIRAFAGSAPAPGVPLLQRGMDLFVAKGCNSCHYHGDTKAQPIYRVGEDLTDKRYSDALLAKMLTDPTLLPRRDIWEMPDLSLTPSEVSALVAFINKPRVQTTTR